MSKKIKILKFGGHSFANADCIRHVVGIIQHQNKKSGLAVVVSAMKGVTNQLISLAESAAKNEDFESDFHMFVQQYMDVIKTLFSVNDTDIRCRLDDYFNELKSDLSSLFSGKKLTPQFRDKILSYGELLSSAILSELLSQKNIPSEQLDACKVILTDDNFGSAHVHYQKSYNRIRTYYKGRKKLQIITGFLGATEDGKTTTLGRNGSDYSASIFGAALNASTIEIWTNVSGILSADPTIVKDARTIFHLTYKEAMELAHAGAKVIFPATMIPAKYKGIPIVIKNTFEPDHPGSCITISREMNDKRVVGISSLSGIALLKLQGAALEGIYGINDRIFSALAKENISVLMVCQSSSENAICFAVIRSLVDKTVSVLESEFESELKKNYIDGIHIEDNISMVAVVGEGMRHTPGISGKIFGRLGTEKINIITFAQGLSERNISFIIGDHDVNQALLALHDEFFSDSKSSVNLYLAGVGTVGNELLSILGQLRPDEIQLKGVSSSQKMILSKNTIEPEKASQPLKQSGDDYDLDLFLDGTLYNNREKIFVDCTASESLSKQYLRIFEKGYSIVTANKIANTLDQNYYQAIRDSAAENGLHFYYEANVCAGLPVISTLKNLVNTGDKIAKIEGVFSGTLSYLFNTITTEIPFSDLVKNAMEMGYTEPDPRQDLNGVDVARKLLILAREIGVELELDNIHIESLLPFGSESIESVEDFLKHLTKFDNDMKSRLEKANSENKKLKFIGKFENGKASVALEAIGLKHPFYELQGSENIIAFHTNRYSDPPLVIKGAGAGAAVTAAGVLGDIQQCLIR
jgi:aspartokinase/homoserine dehydrogenase 1